MTRAIVSFRAPRAALRGAALALLASIALAISAVAPAEAQLDPKYDPSKITSPPMKQIPTVKPERFTLPNGVKVFLLENHDLPVVTGEVNIVSSPVWIAADHAGLGRITGEVVRSGGSAQHSGDWLDDRLAAIGASISTSLTGEMASAQFRSLSDNSREVIGLLAEILQQPALPEDKIELSKVAIRQEIASRNDEMIPLLVRVAQQSIYGRQSPYVRQAEYATLDQITRSDLVTLHGNAFEPGRMVLAVYGDFATADMKKLLTEKFGSWKGKGVALPEKPPLPGATRMRLVFAPKEDVTQTGILMTHLGIRADDPDYPAMDVAVMALGGGFQSRLTNEIRTKRGLAYAAGAGVGEGYQRPGNFIAYTLTKSESTMVALDLVREELRKMVTAPLSDEELKIAKESVQNLFVFNFEQPSYVLFRSAYFEAIGYPQDFLQKYQQGLEAVTAQSAFEAAKRKIHPDQMAVVVVGKEKDFDRPLTSAKLEVERVDISIPPPASKVKVNEATPQAGQKGAALLKKAAEMAGGSAAWAAIKSVNLEQQGTLELAGQQMQIGTSIQWVLPDRRLEVQRLPMGEARQGYDGSKGWRAMMGQVADQPTAAADVKQDYERSFFHIFGQPASLDVQAQAEKQTIDGVAYDVAFVKSETVRDWMLFFAPDGSLTRMQFEGEGPNGPATETLVFADWQPAGPVKYPRAITLLIDGKTYLTAKVTKADMNPTLAAELFKRPEK